ncbi:MAG: conjugative transposon protein TraK [Hymenobacteraceae bacterium]|nr:conjugative transposon protein TraK [Hymenobacteraceae bacterium]MDX5482686.1 conjugative transposon protein TraK [Hymenobacteraceae bacterium]
MKNIDTAFRHVRNFTLLVVVSSMLLCGFVLYRSYALVSRMENKVYVLVNGKALEAFAADRKDNIRVEAREHVKTFHRLFFTLDPDDVVIQANLAQALYLADASAKREHDNLKENGYYTRLIAGNISQRVRVDSVVVDLQEQPYFFRCYATQQLIRATSTVTRSLVTEGYLRNVSRSENNPHGFLIERWSTVENRDLKLEKH